VDKEYKIEYNKKIDKEIDSVAKIAYKMRQLIYDNRELVNIIRKNIKYLKDQFIDYDNTMNELDIKHKLYKDTLLINEILLDDLIEKKYIPFNKRDVQYYNKHIHHFFEKYKLLFCSSSDGFNQLLIDSYWGSFN
jgi:hypothetical protein